MGWVSSEGPIKVTCKTIMLLILNKSNALSFLSYELTNEVSRKQTDRSLRVYRVSMLHKLPNMEVNAVSVARILQTPVTYASL